MKLRITRKVVYEAFIGSFVLTACLFMMGLSLYQIAKVVGLI